MKRTIRLISLIAVFAMVSSIISSCNKKVEEIGTTDENGIKTYTLIMLNHGVTLPTKKPKYYDEIQEKINEKLVKDLGFKIEFNVKSLPDDTMGEKLNIDLAANVSYDLVRMADKTVLANYVDQGLAKDLTQYINNSKNLKTNIGDKVWKEVSINEKIYGIPMPAYPIYASSWIRGDMFEKEGLSVPTTLAELENAMEKIKKNQLNEQDTIVWAITLSELESFLLGNFTDTPGDYIASDGQIMPKIFNPGYKEFIAKLAQWYKAGYIDDFLFNGNNNTSADLLNKTRAAISGTNLWMLEYGTLKAIDKAKPQYKIQFMPQLSDSKKYYSPGLATEYLWVPDSAKNPEIAVKFEDWCLYNEENYNLVNYGLEGKTYISQDGTKELPPAEANDKIKIFSDLMGAFNIGYNLRFNLKGMSKTVPAESIKAYNLYGNTDLSRIYVPVTVYTNTKLADDVKTKRAEATAATVETIANIIKGKADISTYDTMLQKYKQMGGLLAYDEFTKVYKP